MDNFHDPYAGHGPKRYTGIPAPGVARQASASGMDTQKWHALVTITTPANTEPDEVMGALRNAAIGITEDNEDWKTSIELAP